MSDERPVSPPVLELSMLLVDIGSVSAAAHDLVQAVVDDLDVDDPAVSDHYFREEWAPGIAAAMRAILSPHRPDRDGECAHCSPPAAWPCALWRTAYRWMVDLDPTTGKPRNNWYVVTFP
jgi:hypothetical protein